MTRLEFEELQGKFNESGMTLKSFLSSRYHLCVGRTDMRKGINSLIGVVKEKMGANVCNGDVFIFIGRKKYLSGASW